MSLDDDRMPWPAQEAIERGENPQKDTPQFRLARLLAEHDNVHSIHHQMTVAGRVLAFLPRIVAWADAEKTEHRTQLRQQRVASASDEDFFVEQAHYHLTGWREAMAVLSKMGSVHADGYDPDARGADEDDARIGRERADEKRAGDAPDLRAS